MRVLDYLQKKYQVEDPTTMLACEARVFGIPYPLQAGWRAVYGSAEITETLRNRLIGALQAKKGAMAAAGLLTLGVQPSASQLATKSERRAKRAKRAKDAKARKVFELQLKLADRSRAPVFNQDGGKPITVDGASVTSDAFLHTYEWRRLRMVAIKKYGAVCQCCGASPATGAVINVDHIKPRKLFPHLALDLGNLQILCHDCNHGKGNWDMTDWRGAHQEAELDPDQADHLRSIMREA